MEVQLHYNIINAGDESAYVHFHNTKDAAILEEENETEPFAEPTVASIDLKIIDNEIHFKKNEWDGKKYKTNWIRLYSKSSKVDETAHYKCEG